MHGHLNYRPSRFHIIQLLLFISVGWSGVSGANDSIKVEIKKNSQGYQLVRDGSAYRIKGAGMASSDFESLVKHGGNSIRNWSTSSKTNVTQQLLDKALANGITVSLCLEMGLERWGFDYNDDEQVATQLEAIKEKVLRFRDHPALLSWIIGNELNHSYRNPKVYDAVNQVSKMIHRLDPNHPTTTTLAGIDQETLNQVMARASDLDFISFQVYGQLANLPEFIRKSGFNKPFMVTEWGAVGHWEMPETSWGAPIEMNSSEKANNYLKGFQTKLEPLKTQLIGSYAFLWGQKQERTPTWYGLFTETGEATEAIDVLHYIWNDRWPANRAPQLVSLRLNDQTARQNVSLIPGKVYFARVDAFDPESDELSYYWQVKPESEATQEGGDFEQSIQNLSGLINDSAAKQIQLKTPSKPGEYRLFVYVYDGQGHAAHANIPFYVDN